MSELQQTALGLFIVQIFDEDGAASKAADYFGAQGIQWKEVSL